MNNPINPLMVVNNRLQVGRGDGRGGGGAQAPGASPAGQGCSGRPLVRVRPLAQVTLAERNKARQAALASRGTEGAGGGAQLAQLAQLVHVNAYAGGQRQ
jgi:hypothetical protein